MTPAQRIAHIKGLTLPQFLHLWRFEPIGSPWFAGEVGEAMRDLMSYWQAAASPEEWTAASKQVGWNK